MAQISFTIDSVIADVKRHLSIIGKRLYTKEGKNLFSDITLSSAEDRQILTQYITASAQDVEAMLNKFISSSTYDTSVTMDIENTRGDADFSTRAKDFIVSFVTLSTVGEYLSMAHPDIAQKYQADARQRMEALIGYVIYKTAPASASANPLSVNATIS
jgi:hypothetical protein